MENLNQTPLEVYLIFLRLTLLCFTDTVCVWFFLKQIEGCCGNLALSKSNGPVFPVAFIHFVSLCHKSVIVTVFQAFS